MKSGYRFTLVLSVCLLLLAPIVVAQTTGTIEGTVTDQNGGALPGVTVEITSPNLQGQRSATTGTSLSHSVRFPLAPKTQERRPSSDAAPA